MAVAYLVWWQAEPLARGESIRPLHVPQAEVRRETAGARRAAHNEHVGEQLVLLDRKLAERLPQRLHRSGAVAPQQVAAHMKRGARRPEDAFQGRELVWGVDERKGGASCGWEGVGRGRSVGVRGKTAAGSAGSSARAGCWLLWIDNGRDVQRETNRAAVVVHGESRDLEEPRLHSNVADAPRRRLPSSHTRLTSPGQPRGGTLPF
jgi:hypothetical protein